MSERHLQTIRQTKYNRGMLQFASLSQSNTNPLDYHHLSRPDDQDDQGEDDARRRRPENGPRRPPKRFRGSGLVDRSLGADQALEWATRSSQPFPTLTPSGAMLNSEQMLPRHKLWSSVFLCIILGRFTPHKPGS
jgi:hypothetical protein